MTRRWRDFASRPVREQEFMLKNSWCSSCSKADLGILDPQEYEEGGTIFVEGKCRACGSAVRSQVSERQAAGK